MNELAAVGASRSGTLAIATGGASVTFDTEDWDTHGMFAPTSGNLTVIVPGVYIMSAAFQWAASAAGSERRIAISVNGTAVASFRDVFVGGAVPNIVILQAIAATEKLAVNDVITMQGVQNTGGNLNVSISRIRATRIADG